MSKSKKIGVLIDTFQYIKLPKKLKKLAKKLQKECDEFLILVSLKEIKNTTNQFLDYNTINDWLKRKFPKATIHQIVDCESNFHFSQQIVEKIYDKTTSPDWRTLIYAFNDTLEHYNGSYEINSLGARHVENIGMRKIGGKQYRRGMMDASIIRYATGFPTIDVVAYQYSVESNKILLGRKEGSDNWHLPGGFFDPQKDNSFLDTAKRELFEETSIQAEVLKHFDSMKVDDYRYKNEFDKIITTIYEFQIPFETVLNPTDDLIEVRMFSCDEIMKDEFPIMKSHKEIIKLVINIK